jgi:hypothetical protein
MGRLDITGQRFGEAVALEYVGRSSSRKSLWKCQCNCGNVFITDISHLRSGHTHSCGCLQRRRAADYHTIHGQSKTRLFGIWCNMRERCSNPAIRGYKWYGAKGIKVCDEWLKFESFRDWALSHGYQDDLSIDRINSGKDYEPSNCRWVGMDVQASNRSDNRLITCNGVTRTLAEWSRITGLHHSTIRHRIDVMGLSAERALDSASHKKPTM